MLVNRNATNNNQNVDKSRFITMFRDMELRFYEFILKNRQNDTIRDVANFLVPRQIVTLSQNEQKYNTYNLPENFFEFANLHVKAKKDNCVDGLLTVEVKTEDVEEVLNDQFSKPDFFSRETVYHLSEDNKVAVYKGDFEIDKVELTYYRFPRQVDIAGYTRTDGTVSNQDVDPEWDDKEINKILLYMAKDFSANNGDNKYQIEKDRLFESLQ